MLGETTAVGRILNPSGRFGKPSYVGSTTDQARLPILVTSQTLTLSSRLPETNSRPSGLNATLLTRPVWPRKLRTNFPAWLSQIFTVLSSPAEATQRPSPTG